jgi:hypothetical protein
MSGEVEMRDSANGSSAVRENPREVVSARRLVGMSGVASIILPRQQ